MLFVSVVVGLFYDIILRVSFLMFEFLIKLSQPKIDERKLNKIMGLNI